MQNKLEDEILHILFMRGSADNPSLRLALGRKAQQEMKSQGDLFSGAITTLQKQRFLAPLSKASPSFRLTEKGLERALKMRGGFRHLTRRMIDRRLAAGLGGYKSRHYHDRPVPSSVDGLIPQHRRVFETVSNNKDILTAQVIDRHVDTTFPQPDVCYALMCLEELGFIAREELDGVVGETIVTWHAVK